MTEALPILAPQTSKDMSSVTFSQALEAGLTHYDWLNGPKIEKSGRDLALASHSALPGKGKGLTTQDTFGPLFVGSSHSADLQRSLENRLRQRMEGLGSPEYELTWKQWDIGSEPPICAQRASGRRISGKGFTGWPTPKASEGQKDSRTERGALNEMARGNLSCLSIIATMAGWKTPHASDGEGGVMEIREGAAGHYKLRDTVHLAGWPTVTVQDAENNAGPSQFSRNSLPLNTAVVAWTSSRPSGGPAGMESIDEFLPDGWKMPENGKLNPRFSLWLMGYPTEWASCGERVTASSRKSRQSL